MRKTDVIFNSFRLLKRVLNILGEILVDPFVLCAYGTCNYLAMLATY